MLEFTEPNKNSLYEIRFWISPQFISGISERPDGTTTIVTSDGEFWHAVGEARDIVERVEREMAMGGK